MQTDPAGSLSRHVPATPSITTLESNLTVDRSDTSRKNWAAGLVRLELGFQRSSGKKKENLERGDGPTSGAWLIQPLTLSKRPVCPLPQITFRAPRLSFSHDQSITQTPRSPSSRKNPSNQRADWPPTHRKISFDANEKKKKKSSSRPLIGLFFPLFLNSISTSLFLFAQPKLF